MASFWDKWLPWLIGGGVSAAGTILSGRSQAGALDKASELQAASGKEALDFLKGEHTRQLGDLLPYRLTGLAALSDLQNWKPNDPNRTRTPMDLSTFIKAAQAQAKTGSGGGLGSIPAATGDPTKPGVPTFDDISTKGIHSRLGGIASNARTGAGLGSIYGAVMPGVSTAVGTGLGAIYGGISGLWDNNNSDKSFATTGINRVSSWTWDSLVPAVRSGQITPADAEAAFNQVWGKWTQSMANTPGFNKNIAASSEASQRKYFEPFFSEMNRLKQQPAA